MTLQRISSVGPPQTSQKAVGGSTEVIRGAAGAVSSILTAQAARVQIGVRSTRSCLRSREILQNGDGRVSSRRSGHAAPRMGAAPAEIQAVDRCPISGPARNGSKGEELVRRHVGLIDAP